MPENADERSVAWKSDATSVAATDSNGKVTAVAAGTATITATVGGKSATCFVTVTAGTQTDPEVDVDSGIGSWGDQGDITGDATAG